MKLPAIILAIVALAAPVFATPIQDIPYKTMDGATETLNTYKGKVVLVVNVASRCGNTPQYGALEDLYKKYGPQGLVIIGFPCNDFHQQEPGTNAEIKQFCTEKYGVTFPIMDKLHVKGPEQAPLYAALTGPTAKFPGDVKWNFGKFLIDKNGEVIARFEPKTQPADPAVISAIESALK